jgi:hypothetical protein
LEFLRTKPAGRKSWKALVTRTMKKNYQDEERLAVDRSHLNVRVVDLAVCRSLGVGVSGLTKENKARGGIVTTCIYIYPLASLFGCPVG